MRRLIYLGLIVAATLLVGVVVTRGGYRSPSSLATGVVDAVEITKSCPTFSGDERVGDFVRYPVTITNLLGESSIDIVDITDVRDGDSPSNGLVPAPPSGLGPSEVYTGEYVAIITPQDAINGYMDNEISVTVSGGGSYSSSDTASAVECFWDPFVAATVVKTATDGNGNVISTAAYGDFILYVYTVTNTGERLETPSTISPPSAIPQATSFPAAPSNAMQSARSRRKTSPRGASRTSRTCTFSRTTTSRRPTR
jgi:hypothetical protein